MRGVDIAAKYETARGKKKETRNRASARTQQSAEFFVPRGMNGDTDWQTNVRWQIRAAGGWGSAAKVHGR